MQRDKPRHNRELSPCSKETNKQLGGREILRNKGAVGTQVWNGCWGDEKGDLWF